MFGLIYGFDLLHLGTQTNSILTSRALEASEDITQQNGMWILVLYDMDPTIRIDIKEVKKD